LRGAQLRLNPFVSLDRIDRESWRLRGGQAGSVDRLRRVNVNGVGIRFGTFLPQLGKKPRASFSLLT
jgi:hypothetical protein